ncbi:MAG: TatD family hydrolase [Actinomycetota bacterium]
MWFDTHSHISGIEDPRELDEVIARARDTGVEGIVVLGTDAESSRCAVDVARSADLWAGAAFHPTSVKGWDDGWMAEIEPLLDDPSVVAVGETGIDLHWDRTYLPDQEAAFRAHIALAKARGKALVIHTRASVDETLEILEGAGPPERLVFHCWSGDLRQLRRALDLGAHISFAGNITFKSAGDLREAARHVPAERLLIETDSPYLAPVPHRGRSNEPAFVRFVCEAVAESRGETAQVTAAVTTNNARRFFGIEG